MAGRCTPRSKPTTGAIVALVRAMAIEGWHPCGSSSAIRCPDRFSTISVPWMTVPEWTDVLSRAIRSVTPAGAGTNPPHAFCVPIPVGVQYTCARSPVP